MSPVSEPGVAPSPGRRQFQIWAIEIKRGLAPKVEPGLRTALADLRPERAYLVYGGEERYPKGDRIEASGVQALAQELAALAA